MHKHLTGVSQQISIFYRDIDLGISFGLGRENRKETFRILYSRPQRVMFSYADLLRLIFLHILLRN